MGECNCAGAIRDADVARAAVERQRVGPCRAAYAKRASVSGRADGNAAPAAVIHITLLGDSEIKPARCAVVDMKVGTCGIRLDGERAGAGQVCAEREIIAGERKVIGAAGDGGREVGGRGAGIDDAARAQHRGAVKGDILVGGSNVCRKRRRASEGECSAAGLRTRYKNTAAATGDERYRRCPGVGIHGHSVAVGRIAESVAGGGGVGQHAAGILHRALRSINTDGVAGCVRSQS